MRASIIAKTVFFFVISTSGCAVTRDREAAVAPIHDDRVITSSIRARYAQSDRADTTCISVETLYGVVLLSGVVNSPQEKMAAQNIAEQVDGVKAVHNEILLQAENAGGDASPGCRSSTGHG